MYILNGLKLLLLNGDSIKISTLAKNAKEATTIGQYEETNIDHEVIKRDGIQIQPN